MKIQSYSEEGEVITKKAVIYLRVSTEEQVENYSLGSQEEICKREAARRGYQIAEIFKEEGRSAKNISGRPILIQMLEYCRNKKNSINAVFIYRLDRISRQTSDYLAIRKKLTECGVNIISTSEPTGDTPAEKLMETMLAGIAQLDNDIKSERTKTGLRRRFLDGLICTNPPCGYILQSGYAIKDPESFELMRQAWELMATGSKSLNEMAEIVNKWGLRTTYNGKKHELRRNRLDAIFRSKFYMGVLTSKKYPEEVRGQHTPMITEEQFYKVQAIIDGTNPNKLALSQHRVRDNPTFPLRRFARCGKCGAALTGGFSKGKMGVKYPYYRCQKACSGKSIPARLAETELMDVLKSITPIPQCRELFITFIQEKYHQRKARLEKLRNEADGEIAKLHQTRRQLVEKNLAGIYSDDIFKEQNIFIEDKILRAQIAKHDELFEKYDVPKITDFMKTMLADLGGFYSQSDISQKKAFLSSIFPLGITWNYPGYYNSKIGALYQFICPPNTHPVLSGAPERN